ncbi:MAG: helix-turn-helix transcriptional regulator [bacterium]
MDSTSKKLAELRNKEGFTQAEIAERLDISIPAYSMYENGQRKIPAGIAMQIAQILGCSVEDIFLPTTFAVRKEEPALQRSNKDHAATLEPGFKKPRTA